MEKQGPLGSASQRRSELLDLVRDAGLRDGRSPPKSWPCGCRRRSRCLAARPPCGERRERARRGRYGSRAAALIFGQNLVSPRQPWGRSAEPSANRSAESCACPPRSGGCHPPVQRPTRSPAPTPRLPKCNEVSFRSPWVPVFADGSYCALMSTHPSRAPAPPMPGLV